MNSESGTIIKEISAKNSTENFSNYGHYIIDDDLTLTLPKYKNTISMTQQ